MSAQTKTLDSERQVQQIVEALVTLPPEKVAEVHDFVIFLQDRYSQLASAAVSHAPGKQDRRNRASDPFSHSTARDDTTAEHPHASSITVPPEFLDSIAAFERLLPQLLEQYRGQAVAIYQGRVVASGDDKMAVLGQVLDEYGPVPCYIEWVDPESPRRARVPSVWVKR
ncbi:MAG: hypothetical protein KF893_14090 [Caldilineaceae bacterium]|nr:hypothetical protein [Caldilineaceae bacterium]